MKGFILMSTLVMVLLVSLVLTACVQHTMIALSSSQQYFIYLQSGLIY